MIAKLESQGVELKSLQESIDTSSSSRGDYSYLVQPKKDSKYLMESLYSLAHGAGRKWIRSECRDRLSKRYKKSDLERTTFGSRVICKNKDLIYEEAPEAYKSISSVIEVMREADQ